MSKEKCYLFSKMHYLLHVTTQHTSANLLNYVLLKTCPIMIYQMNIWIIYESLLQNIMKILPIIYQNKTKVLGKSSKFQVQLRGKLY